ncbi:MAG: 23S rRNA pseudouridine(2604) synthase RluF [Flavobacteriaceae bacterium]|nr:23S rRNA pseudouridine(2604) synthase RluF [Flavobacteriaceae bacterium]|tara:strand:- start:21595 stop:22317 length:723 start_codon:yes stop_codon:yes gene_type:complete
MESLPKRLNKYLSEAGFCSRRSADKLIDEGRVKINGILATMGEKVNPQDEIEVDGKIIKKNKKISTYIAFNKPLGIVCTTDTRVEKNNIIDFINYPTRIFPIGRLDKDSEGLILLTDDGDIVNKILRSSNNHEKEYIVTIDKTISQTFIKRMSEGVPILDTITKPCKIQKLSRNSFRITLTQGLNRQIRRMCEYLNYKVESLQRVRIMNIHLKSKVGSYRDLTHEELKTLKNSLKNSKKS